jgi:hypothetical protein
MGLPLIACHKIHCLTLAVITTDLEIKKWFKKQVSTKSNQHIIRPTNQHQSPSKEQLLSAKICELLK